MCTAASRGLQLENLENPYRCKEPRKEKVLSFWNLMGEISLKIMINTKDMYKYSKTIWNTTVFFIADLKMTYASKS